MSFDLTLSWRDKYLSLPIPTSSFYPLFCSIAEYSSFSFSLFYALHTRLKSLLPLQNMCNFYHVSSDSFFSSFLLLFAFIVFFCFRNLLTDLDMVTTNK